MTNPPLKVHIYLGKSVENLSLIMRAQSMAFTGPEKRGFLHKLTTSDVVLTTYGVRYNARCPICRNGSSDVAIDDVLGAP